MEPRIQRWKLAALLDHAAEGHDELVQPQVRRPRVRLRLTDRPARWLQMPEFERIGIRFGVNKYV
jgi:hypothetical protein